jgi:transposase
MPQKLKLTGSATPEELVVARKTYLDRHDQERLIAVQMAQDGDFKRADIAKAIGRSTVTIGRWLRKYRQGGIEELLKRGHGARKPQLQPQDLDALNHELKKGQWKTGKEIQHWFSKRGISLSIPGVYYWLSKVKARCKVPRKKHKDQDSKAVESFKSTVVDKLHELDIPPGQRVLFWIEDEHRYGLISNVRRCWTLRGHRPTAPVQMKYQWGYVYGAAEVSGGDAQFLYLPTVSLSCSCLFLEQLVATDKKAIHIVFWDQAGFHPKPKACDLPPQIRLIELPAYSPELNAMEHLWDCVKRHVSNAVWETLTAIEGAITEVLKPFWESAARVWQLLGDSWLTRSVKLFLEQSKEFI